MSIKMQLPVEIYDLGTIVEVDFPYEEDNRVKHRPAVVMNYDDNETCVALLKVTSKEPTSPYDYKITDYQLSKLPKNPSYVKCNCTYMIPNSTCLQKMGNLSRKDANAVKFS